MRKVYRIFALGIIAATLTSLASPGPTLAGTITNSISINASVTTACQINSTTSPAAEAITAAVTPPETSGTVSATCTNGSYFNVQLGAGSHGTDGNPPIRYIANGTNQLQYQIYQDSAETNVWGDGTGGSAVSNNTGNGSAMVFTYWVQISTPPWALPAGAYSDTVGVTVAF